MDVDRRTLLKLVGAGWALPAAASARAEAVADPWTIIALTDTQYYAKNERYGREQAEWIVDNLEEENIVFVSHGGDVVHNADIDAEWAYMDDAISLFDGQVPYATVTGNHEYEVWWDRSSSIENYKQYFGPQNFEDREWYGGAGPTNGDPNRDELNSYQLFSAGGYDFLHLALEWEAPGSVDDPNTPLGWAQSVLDQYPDRPTILTTHSYLRDDTEDWSAIVQEENGNGNTGKTIWEQLVKPNSQVFMALCGHWWRADGEYHQVSTNAAGRDVYEMVANYQGRYLQGRGYLRRIEFRPGEGSDAPDRIQVRSYSPVLDEYYDDADSEFAFDLDFDERFDMSTDSTTTVAFQQGADGYEGTVDTDIREADPGTNNATAPTLNVDADDPNGTDQAVQAVMRFTGIIGDGSEQIPAGADVTSATLTVETTNDGDGAFLHRMLTAWSETDTWNTFGGDGIQADGVEAASSADAATGSTSLGVTSIPVTESVQAWVDGQSNYGWAFLPSGDNGWDFDSAEGATPPELTVTYEAGSGGGETPVAVSTDTATDIGETSATLNGTLDDLGGASSADVSFEYRERGTSSWSATGVQTLSSTGSFGESVSGLSSGTEYEYRAVAEASDGDTAIGDLVEIVTQEGSSDDTLTIEEAVASADETGDDTKIEFTEIQQATNWWQTDAEVPNTGGQTIEFQKMQELIDLWQTDATIGDGN